MNNKELGKNGENIAKEYLIKQGYKIIEMNKRFSRFCEIDIIAENKGMLIFCEVKTRKTDLCGTPFEAITASKYQNIKKGAYMYLQENPKYKKFRIDAIGITLKPEFKIEHLKNI